MLIDQVKAIIARVGLSVLAWCMLFAPSLFASPPANMFHDPVIIHSIKGVNPFPDYRESTGLVFDILPFYQNAKGAKNCKGDKVPKGDRLGRMNMIGLLQGKMPTTPVLTQAFNALPSSYQDMMFTGSDLLGRYSLRLDNDKFGIRGKLRISSCGHGFALTARSGAVCYRQIPCFTDLTPSATLAGFPLEEIIAVQDLLTREGKRNAIAKELGVSLEKVTRTSFEDTHVEASWSGAFRFDDDEGNHAISVTPFIAVGAWIPTGESMNHDILFRLPMGNDGFWGITVEGILNFEFPDTVQVGIGGAVTFHPDDRIRKLRLPTSVNQHVLFPCEVCVKQDMGVTWQAHAGLMAKDFVGNLSFYSNYIYTKHQRDEFCVIEGEENAELFLTDKAQRESTWESQMVHAGLDYRTAKEIYFGVGYQANITGKRIYKTSTLIGTIRFDFT